MQMLCKGSRLQPKAGSQRISTTAQQQDLIKGTISMATGILSTGELTTHLQYTIPDAKNQVHLLLLTHEMWELPTPLIAANEPSREIEVRELHALLQDCQNDADPPPAQRQHNNCSKTEAQKSNSWELQLDRAILPHQTPQKALTSTTQGRCLRTPHQLQANVRKQYPNEASQQEESNVTTLALVGTAYRRQSKKIRFGEQ
ncbi:iron-sulfur protein NUBPL [Dorcoceras hygrometricum]|uniref:Iron-sulfur protein NUBPL n=1 Tax=Dorcoceras hygrometricum TaxID=472368 RepID=A0A2Z7AF44_9LAMI|nr:iron-sulfur protein NUBPL [Dorcoceras hygrometricum]